LVYLLIEYIFFNYKIFTISRCFFHVK